jgi:hypothetical protein
MSPRQATGRHARPRTSQRHDRTVQPGRLLDGPPFQPPGPAEAELEVDPHRTIRLFLYGLSGAAPAGLVEHLYVGKAPGARLPNLCGVAILPGCGHWVQQKKACEVNEMIVRFLSTEAQKHARKERIND